MPEKTLKEKVDLKPCLLCRNGESYPPKVEHLRTMYPTSNVIIHVFGGVEDEKDCLYAVVCGNCGAQGGAYKFKAQAIAAWNERPALTALEERVEELEELYYHPYPKD